MMNVDDDDDSVVVGSIISAAAVVARNNRTNALANGGRSSKIRRGTVRLDSRLMECVEAYGWYECVMMMMRSRLFLGDGDDDNG